jgi:quinone-modifying oxidoreductase subunit QmoC
MGKLVANASSTWPILLGVPFLFWVVMIYAYNGLTIPEAPLVYKNFVPHLMIDTTFISVATLVVIMAGTSAMRFWNLLGTSSQRSGSFISNLIPAVVDVLTHKRFGSCETGGGGSRKTGHLLLFFGFVGAAITTGIIALILYGTLFLTGEHAAWPLPMLHPVKILGNISAVLLAIGGVSLLLNRMQEDKRAGATTAYDTFFLTVVLLVVASGILSEVGRFTLSPAIACWIYVVHLTSVLSLFITFPYSKFAHMLYRTLAMVHERMSTSQNK